MPKSPELECSVEDDFNRRMEQCGFIHKKGDLAAWMEAGNPDEFYYGFGAVTVIVEFKRDRSRDRRRGHKLQEFIRNEYKRRGFPVYKVKGRDEAARVFKLITGEEL